MQRGAPSRRRGPAAPAPVPKQHIVFAQGDGADEASASDLDEGSETDTGSELDAGSKLVDDADGTSDASDSDSDVEELTMASTRAMAKQQFQASQAQRHAERAARTAAAKERPSAKMSRRARKEAQRRVLAEDAEDEDEDQDEGGELEAAPARLDPALFAAALAKTGDAAARDVLRGTSATSAPRSASRRDGLARGYDGQPIARLRKERTVLRALADDDDDDHYELPDAPLMHTPLDPHRALPSSRVRGFKKQKLALRAKDARPMTWTQPKRSRRSKPAPRDEDDPLGLHDPAFLPGGEFASLTGRPRSKASKRGSKTSTGALALRYRGAGGRVQGTCPFLPQARPLEHTAPLRHLRARGHSLYESYHESESIKSE